MRPCSKSHCTHSASATIALRYERRQVAMVDLLPERDPNHLELCAEHADRLVPPIGWTVQDERAGHRHADPLEPHLGAGTTELADAPRSRS